METGEDKKKCCYYLEERSVEMLRKIAQERRLSGIRTKRQCSKSHIVDDAIRMAFEYEVLGKSHIHPDD